MDRKLARSLTFNMSSAAPRQIEILSKKPSVCLSAVVVETAMLLSVVTGASVLCFLSVVLVISQSVSKCLEWPKWHNHCVTCDMYYVTDDYVMLCI